MGKYEGWTIISDYDGTLTSGSGSISPEDIGAINYFMENGGQFSVATGRSGVEMAHFLGDAVKTNAPGIYYNGAVIQEPGTGKVLYSRPLPDSYREIVRKCQEEVPGLNICLGGKDTCVFVHRTPFTEEIKREFLEELHIPDMGLSVEEVISILAMDQPWCVELTEQNRDDEYYKILLWGLREDVKKAGQALAGLTSAAGCISISSIATNSEIASKDVSKGAAVRWLSEHGDHGKIFALGDGENDITMFEAADYSAAPAFANVRLRQMADYVCREGEKIVPAAIRHIDGLLARGRS